jgi:hypothetical protein
MYYYWLQIKRDYTNKLPLNHILATVAFTEPLPNYGFLSSFHIPWFEQIYYIILSHPTTYAVPRCMTFSALFLEGQQTTQRNFLPQENRVKLELVSS